MQLDRTKAKELFIWGNINPARAMMYRKAAGLAGLLIYLYVRWKMGIPNYITRKKSEWVKLDNVAMARHGFKMDPKTKNNGLRKLEKENLIQLHLLDNSGKAPLVRLLVK